MKTTYNISDVIQILKTVPLADMIAPYYMNSYPDVTTVAWSVGNLRIEYKSSFREIIRVTVLSTNDMFDITFSLEVSQTCHMLEITFDESRFTRIN